MFGSQLLEVAIGIIFIFLLVSIICSAVREGIEAWLKTRASYLEYGIRELLHDKEATGLAKSFYEHPLIYSLFSNGYQPKPGAQPPGLLANGANLPSYIPAANFAKALMDIAARGPVTDVVSSDPNAPVISLATIRSNLLNLGNPAVQRVLLTALDSAQGDLDQAQANIEAWYNSGMDRVSGWYKRSTNWVLFWIGLFVAIAMNINVIDCANILYKDDATRATVVARAQEAAKDTSFLSRKYQKAKTELDSLGLPIGWKDVTFAMPGSHTAVQMTTTGPKVVSLHRSWWDYVVSPVLGWLILAFAATMGAPFWFDLLNKVMVIRSTVKPHEKSLEEDSEDRQLPKAREANLNGGNQQGGVQHHQGGNQPPPPGQQPMIPVITPRDAESSLDGCSVLGHNSLNKDITTDDQLPVAQGGVAQ